MDLIKVELCNNFGAVNTFKKKGILEEFSFADKKSSAHEIIRCNIQEGSTLSCLGELKLDENGSLYMSHLMAVIAGGMVEAKEFLAQQIKASRQCTVLYGTLAAFLVGTLYFAIVNDWKANQRDVELAALREKNEKNELGTPSPEDMKTHCTICYVKGSNVVFVPCHHLCMCFGCFEDFKKASRQKLECPMCRTPIEKDRFMLV